MGLQHSKTQWKAGPGSSAEQWPEEKGSPVACAGVLGLRAVWSATSWGLGFLPQCLEVDVGRGGGIVVRHWKKFILITHNGTCIPRSHRQWALGSWSLGFWGRETERSWPVTQMQRRGWGPSRLSVAPSHICIPRAFSGYPPPHTEGLGQAFRPGVDLMGRCSSLERTPVLPQNVPSPLTQKDLKLEEV